MVVKDESKRKTLCARTHTHTQKSKIEDVRLKSVCDIEKENRIKYFKY